MEDVMTDKELRLRFQSRFLREKLSELCKVRGEFALSEVIPLSLSKALVDHLKMAEEVLGYEIARIDEELVALDRK
jgi:hypothetical protein